MYAQVLGALCLLRSFALRYEAQTDIDRDIRMRGPARFAVAAETYAGLEEGDITTAYLSTRAQATAAAADDDFVAGFLEWQTAEDGEWSGTATALLGALVKHAAGENEKARKPDWLPKTARGLRAKLDKFASTLLDLGVTLSFEAGGRGAQKRNIIRVNGAGSNNTPQNTPRGERGD